MSKLIKFSTMVMVLVFVCMAFAPATLAATTYAPYSWSKWPVQKMLDYDVMPTKVIRRYMAVANEVNLAIDGEFGSNIGTLVARFQVKVGLDADAIVGEKTWARLQDKLVYFSTTPAKIESYRVRTFNSMNGAPVVNIKANSYLWDPSPVMPSLQSWAVNVMPYNDLVTARWESVTY